MMFQVKIGGGSWSKAVELPVFASLSPQAARRRTMPSFASSSSWKSSSFGRGAQMSISVTNLELDSPSSHKIVLATLGPSSNSSNGKFQFMEAAKKGNLIPVFERTFQEQLTPELTYGCLVKEDEIDSPSFLFDGLEEGRYSSLGTQPAIEIIAKENKVVILNHDDGSREEKILAEPMNEPGKYTSDWNPVMVDGLPDTFCGGWVGYSPDNTTKYVAKKAIPFRSVSEDDRGVPDTHLGLYKDVVVFDHAAKLVYAIHWVQLEQFETAEIAYSEGKVQLGLLMDLVLRLKGVGAGKLL